MSVDSDTRDQKGEQMTDSEHQADKQYRFIVWQRRPDCDICGLRNYRGYNKLASGTVVCTGCAARLGRVRKEHN